jgi:outer membrane autotransporter protein
MNGRPDGRLRAAACLQPNPQSPETTAMTSHRHNEPSRSRRLSMAITMALAAPTAFAGTIAAPTSDYSTSAHFDFNDQTVETTDYGKTAIRVNDPDTVSAVNTDVITHGGLGMGVWVDGAGASMDFNGGSITTEGRQAYGALAQNGATMNFDGTRFVTHGVSADAVLAQSDSNVTVRNASIESFGDSLHAVLSNGTLAISDTNITTHGVYARGMFLNDNGKIVADRVTIATEGETSHGVHMGTGRLEFNDSSIVTKGNTAYGVVNLTGEAVLNNSTISTAGDNAIGLNTQGPSSTSSMTGGSITTAGLQAYGAHATDGAQVALADTAIRTKGHLGHGINAVVGGKASASGVNITTTGTNARGLYIDGADSSIQFAGGTVTTSAANADGAYIANGGSLAIGRDAKGVGTTINVNGAANGVLVGYGSATGSGNARIDGATIKAAKGTALNTQGTGSVANVTDSVLEGIVGVIVKDGSAVSVADSAIRGTLARFGHGVDISTGGRFSGQDVDIGTSGSNSIGVKVDGAGSSATLVGGTITTTGENGSYGVHALAGGSATVDGMQVSTGGRASSAFYALDGGTLDIANATATTSGEISRGLVAEGNGASITARNVDITTSGLQAYGVLAYPGGSVAMDRVTIRTSGQSSHGLATTKGDGSITGTGVDIETTGQSSFGIFMGSGSSVAVEDSRIRANGEFARGALVKADAGETTTLDLKGTEISNADMATFEVRGEGNNVINLVGSRASADAGTLLTDMSPEATPAAGHTEFNASASTLRGDILLSDAYNVAATFTNGTEWTGAAQKLDSLDMTDSLWNLTGSSTLGMLSLANSVIDFAAPVDGYKTLDIAGNLAGTGGVIAMNTLLNGGGALSNQATDRLLVRGDVTTTGTTFLDVKPQGDGGLTDTNQNGIVEANEGISLVQVAGQSREDAFALKGGYVAAGPWQYTLHAFGPGQVDPSQNALGGGDFNWDYRLGNAYVTDPEKPNPGDGDNGGNPDPGPNPGDGDNGNNPGPGPVDPIDEGNKRPAVVPQLPSYISAPTALMAYGNQVTDTLHQRLGEIRNVTPGQKGEVFARVIGGNAKYKSDLGFKQYGYDFDQQTHALQVGGSILGWSGDNSSIRAGWALDKGTTRVTPKAADGSSRAKYDANGVSAWLTWQQDNGFYVDAIVGGQRYKGTVSTDLRGADVAKVKANGWTASVETGYPITLGKGWAIEPQAQLKRQSLSFREINDADGLTTRIAPTGQTIGRLGARLTKSDDAKFAPYLRADVIRTIGGRAKVTSTSEAWNMQETFAGGRVGTSWRAGAGATSQLTKNLSLYGEADYQKGTGNSGFRGWAGTMGVRYNF